MAYQDNYEKYLGQVPAVIQRCRQTGKRPVMAYTSNLDVVVQWDPGYFQKLLDRYMKAEPVYQKEETIDSMEDFVRILSYYAIHGFGGEVEITSGKVVEMLKEYFPLKYGLGGTCAQGAAALGAMKVPVLIHVTDQAEEVLEWLDYEGVESIKDGKRVPIMACVSGETPAQHIIFQFTKGDILEICGKKYEVPVSNRLITDYDQIHKIMPVKQDFLRYLEENAENMYSYDISGFNAIVSLDVIKERLEELKAHYKVLKSRNPDIKVYFESAHFISAKVRDYLYEDLSPYWDIMGMNEEELVDLMLGRGMEVDQDDLVSILEGLDAVLKLYPVKGIVMHSKDYALYYGEPMEGVDLEMGLTIGNLMSGTRARIGRYGTQEECRETMSLSLSPVGVRFAEQAAKMDLKKKLVLVPSRYMEKPRYTIGLGDTFVAGMQICFVK